VVILVTSMMTERRRSGETAAADGRGSVNSGELDTATRGSGTSTGCTGGFLTLLRSSGQLLDDQRAAAREIKGSGWLGFDGSGTAGKFGS
jgi:hypothetical protein